MSDQSMPGNQINGSPDAAMSTPETIAGIYFEPGRTFEALRERPRFLVAAIICIAAFMLFNITYFQRIGFETVIRAETDANPRLEGIAPEQKDRAIESQLKPAFKAFRLLSPILGFAVFFAAGAGLYLLGAIAVGGRLNYKQALSVWTYSSLPPTVLMMLINFVLLFAAPPEDDISIARGARRGLAHANLGFLVDPAASPVLTTVLGSFDIFTAYGIFLAAIGLRKVGRLSTGAAWGTALALWLVGLILRVGLSAVMKTPMA
ncbi:MAG: YIP1 family protein [Pyrinomonadaceae bacterium]